MKTIIRLFAAVLTAVPVLVSCYSEPLPEVIPEVIPEDEGNGSEQDATTRIITLSFDTKATRTVLSDETDYFSVPVFRPYDEIVVAQANGQAEPQKFTLNKDNFVGEVATIKTNLSGPLVAVYPASCALYDSENSNIITGVKVPSKQNGTFANANICMATQTDDDIAQNRLSFKNKTAVFVVDLPYPEETIELVVESLYKISSSTGQRDEDASYSYIACDGIGEDDYSDIITVSDEENGLESPCFVSVYVGDGILLRDLNFDAVLSFVEGTEMPYNGFMGGFSPRFLEGKNMNPSTNTVQMGAIYTGVETCMHEYLVTPRDATKPGTVDMRWAVEDLEANGGKFFMWGELDGHSYVNGLWTGFANEGGFSSKNKNSLSKTYSKNEVLRLEDDAAYQNWGGAWRIPTYNELKTVTGAGGQYTIARAMSCCGYVSGTSNSYMDSSYYYWAADMYTNSMNARCFRYSIGDQGTIESSGTPYMLLSSCYGMRIKPTAPID